MKNKKGKYKKYQTGGQTPPLTTQDSLDLFNSNNAVFDYYFNNPNYTFKDHVNMGIGDIHGLNKLEREAFVNRSTYDSPTYIRQSNIPADIDTYYKKVSPYRYMQREIANMNLNTNAPMQLFDTRIQPTHLVNFMENNILNSDDPLDVKAFGMDNALIGLYDPASIWPKSMGIMPSSNLASKVNPGVPTAKAYVPNMETDLSAYLKSEGKGFSYADRKKLAEEYNIKDYKGTADQNIALLQAIKNGKAIDPSLTNTLEGENNTVEPTVTSNTPVQNTADKSVPDNYVRVTIEGDSSGTQSYMLKSKAEKMIKAGYKLKIMEGQKEIPDIYSHANGGIAQGALNGAMTGVQIGSFLPGPGNLIGGLAGALIGGIDGSYNNQEVNNNNMGITNSNPYGTITMANGGFNINNPLINIEAGELMVDANSGDIIEEYSTDRGFKAHSKTSEDSRNFVPSVENGVVIPKKYAEQYKSNKDIRTGIIRDVVNKQIDRELYGVDADGNKVQYANIEKDFKKMKSGGFAKKYGLGGIDDKDKVPSVGLVDLPGYNNYMYGSPSQFPTDPLMSNLNSIPLIENTNNQIYVPPFQGSTMPKDPVMDNINSIPLVDKPGTFSTSTANANSLPSYPAKPMSESTPVDNNLWTLGNTLGLVGAGISAFGPLATTLSNGIDKTEENYFNGVSTRAEGEANDIFRGVERRGVRDIQNADNVSQNLNRNRTTNFGSMLSNAQNINRNTQRSIGDFLSNVGSERAKIMSDFMFRGDMANAQGLTARDERLDQNRDNFYSNLSNNLSNAGDNIQGVGRNLNQHTTNDVQLNILQQISPDFGIDAHGQITYKGKLI